MNEIGQSASPKQIRFRICFVLILLLMGGALITLGFTFFNAFNPPAEQEIPVPIALSQPVATSTSVFKDNNEQGIIPASLSIPSLSVFAPVQILGINVKGNIATPSSFSATGWYRYGPEPGDPGIALIDGHVNNGLGLAGVFLNLYTIKNGADIYISDKNKNKLHFVVSAVYKVPYTSHLDDILAGESEKSQLAIVTCDGSWVENEKTYNQRIVVLAELESMR